MAQMLDAVEDRLHAVLCSGRGSDGALGTDAQARAVPAGHFRRPQTDASVRDPQYPPEELDRAVSIEWLSIEDTNEVHNEYDSAAIRTVRCNVLVGYVAAPALSGLAHELGGETEAGAVAHWRRRALGDAERIKRALCFLGLAGGTLSDGVEWVGCTRDGATTLEDLGEGRALSSSPYVLTIAYTLTTAYTP